MINKTNRKKNHQCKVHVRTDDTVMIISGDDKGKTGKVLVVSPKENKIIVEGINKVTKHVKPRKQGEQGGRIEAEAAFYACKAQLYCPSCKKPTRVAHHIGGDGSKERICAKCRSTL